MAIQSARPGISGCLHGTDGPLLLGRVQAPGAPIATGAHAEIAVGIGVGGGLPEHELHRLDPPQATGEPRLAVEEIPAAAAAAVMPRPHLVRLSLPAQGTPQQLLPARLKKSTRSLLPECMLAGSLLAGDADCCVTGVLWAWRRRPLNLCFTQVGPTSL